MNEIRTRIDEVLDFIQERGTTTKKEVSRELCLDADELDKFITLLHKNHMIEVRYGLANTYLCVGEQAIATSY